MHSQGCHWRNEHVTLTGILLKSTLVKWLLHNNSDSFWNCCHPPWCLVKRDAVEITAHYTAAIWKAGFSYFYHTSTQSAFQVYLWAWKGESKPSWKYTRIRSTAMESISSNGLRRLQHAKTQPPVSQCISHSHSCFTAVLLPSVFPIPNQTKCCHSHLSVRAWKRLSGKITLQT